jgi:hypothetical protein
MASLQGKRVVFTGFRDSDLQSKIEGKGGKVISAVSGVTNIIVTSDENSSKKSGKIKEAEALCKKYGLCIEILTKQKFINKYINAKSQKTKSFSLFGSLFGKKQKEPEVFTPSIPPTDPPNEIKSAQSYLIHDNGGRPFQVNLTKTTFAVYRQSKIAEQGKGWVFYEGPYDKAIIKPTKYMKVYVGRDPNYGKKFDGNTILVQVSANKYIYIGSEIESVEIPEKLIGYKSPIYGSDVAYPYAYGEKNTYLFLERTFIPNDILRNKDPYIHLYNQDMKDWGTRKQQDVERKFKSTHKLKYKLLQKRI